jgi:predicted urease superfamily metal-dependent hydrolase
MTADPSAVLANAPFLGTAALWAQMYPVTDDTVTDRVVMRPAAHWIGKWGPHWPLDWSALLDREAFEDALRKAMAAAKKADVALVMDTLQDMQAARAQREDTNV